MAVVLSLVSSLLWGAGDFGGGLMSRRLPSVLAVMFAQIAGLLALTVAAAAFGTFDHVGRWAPWGVAAGVVGGLSLVAFYAALASGTMGVVSPIAAMGAIVPVLVGLIGGERPTVLVVAGVLVALGGAVAASGPELAGGAPARPVLLAALSGLGFGFFFVFAARGSATNVLMTMWAQRAASVLVLTALAFATGHARRVGVRDAGLLAIVGLADVGANISFAVASTLGFVSVTSVLGSLYPVVTVVLARIVLGERMLVVQRIGVVAALVGVVMVSVG